MQGKAARWGGGGAAATFAALRSAKDLVESYDYRQDQSVSASGAPSFRTMLVARFRQDDVDGLVAALGLGLMLGAVLPALIAFLVIWYGSEALFARAMGWGEGLRDIAAYALRDAMLPALWCAAWAGNSFEWRGNAMTAAEIAKDKP